MHNDSDKAKKLQEEAYKYSSDTCFIYVYTFTDM